MKAESVLLDTGPLVAMLAPPDPFHIKCLHEADKIRGRLITCEAVVTEAAYLLQHTRTGVDDLLKFVASEDVLLFPIPADGLFWIRRFRTRYADQTPDFADMCLMHLADRFNLSDIFTLDRRDFSVYRRTDGSAMNILPQASESPA